MLAPRLHAKTGGWHPPFRSPTAPSTLPHFIAPDDGVLIVRTRLDHYLELARGDRHFTLVGLLFAFTWCTIDPRWSGIQHSAIDRLDEILTATLDPGLLRLYWAHWSLRQLDLTISHHTPESIELHLDLGESRL